MRELLRKLREKILGKKESGESETGDMKEAKPPLSDKVRDWSPGPDDLVWIQALPLTELRVFGQTALCASVSFPTVKGEGNTPYLLKLL